MPLESCCWGSLRQPIGNTAPALIETPLQVNVAHLISNPNSHCCEGSVAISAVRVQVIVRAVF